MIEKERKEREAKFAELAKIDPLPQTRIDKIMADIKNIIEEDFKARSPSLRRLLDAGGSPGINKQDSLSMKQRSISTDRDKGKSVEPNTPGLGDQSMA